MLHRPAFAKWSETVSPAVLYRLMVWFSPAFPVGAFSYSSGIEWAVEAGDIQDAKMLECWLKVMLSHGSGYCDAVFLVQTHHAVTTRDDALLHVVAERAPAMAASKERFIETTQQGQAFLDTMRATWPCAALDRLVKIWHGQIALPVAAGVASAGHGMPVEATVVAYLQAMMANLVSAGVRLVPLGQTDGQRVVAGLETDIAAAAERALAASLDDVASCALRADLATMRHEAQYTRLFRS